MSGGMSWNMNMADPAAAMAGCTPEQWTLMQQQNWQQWATWQQQYAQWQSQYGEKYVQQMQGMAGSVGGMGSMPGMPPLPASTAPVPPPPPPHENNQPLYNNKATTGSAVEAPRPPGYGVPAGNAWSAPAPPSDATTVNADALKKLAEEERLFDIQFQKWEDEIEKWKLENVNHPDKQAYKEYELKFEACRVQLLDRRKQMDARKARLLGQAPTNAQGNPLVTPTNANNANAYEQSAPPQSYPNAPQPNNQPQSFPTMKTNLPHNQNQPNFPRQYQNHHFNTPNQNQPYNAPRGNMPHQNQNAPYQGHNQNSHKSNNIQVQQVSAPAAAQNRNDNKNVNPQDRYEVYNTGKDTKTQDTDNSSFLSSSAGGKGIPGLDLVPEEKAKLPPIIDITDDNPRAPDYSNISLKINNILGDEKLMNILTNLKSVRDEAAGAGPSQGMNNRSMPPDQGPKMPPSGYNMPPGNQVPPSGYNMPPSGHNMPPSGHNMPPNRQNMPPSGYNMPPGGHNNMPPSGYNMPPGGQNMPYNNMANNRNMPPNQNQWDNNYNANNQNMQQNRPPNHPNQLEEKGDYYNDGKNMPPRNQMGHMGYGEGQNMPPRNMGPPPLMSIRPNVPQRLPLQDMSGQQNMEFSRREPPAETPPEQKWVEEPLFTPSIIVEYEHKPLRLKARDFIDPVHMFDYNHVSKEEEFKHADYEREADDLFARDPLRPVIDDRPMFDRERDHMKETLRDYLKDPPRDYLRETPRDYRDREIPREYKEPPRERSRDFERRPPREEREDYSRSRPHRDDREFEDRRRDSRFDDRKRDDQFTRRDERKDDGHRDRDFFARREDSRRDDDRRDHYSRREDYRSDHRREDHSRRDDVKNTRERSRERVSNHRSHSRDASVESRKRAVGSERDSPEAKKAKEASKKADPPQHVVMIDDILEPPGRAMRPDKIVIVLRGPPGSGKSYVAKLIRDREAEHGGAARIMSIDDYFMQEGEIEETDPNTGKIIKKPSLKYEYDANSEETYLNSLKRAFKRSITDGYFNFLIFDAVNDQLKSYADIWNFSRQNGFQVYVCTLELDAAVCHARCIHGRSMDDIEVIVARWFPTPAHHLSLDATSLLQAAAIQDVTMEDATHDLIADADHRAVDEVESSFTSKWETMDDARQLARLDGTSKPLRPSQLSMEDYLQLDDWTPNKAAPGKKTVRWADLEERREQEKMRAIGFVVGQTDWGRMTDPSCGAGALATTKYIERVRRN